MGSPPPNCPTVTCCWKFSIYGTPYSLCSARRPIRYHFCTCIIMLPFWLRHILVSASLRVSDSQVKPWTMTSINLGWCWSISGGHAWFFGLMNCFVHVVMYGYYFGSVHSPTLKQNMTVKKSITQMQIVSGRGRNFFGFDFKMDLPFTSISFQIQFVLTIIHMTRPLIMQDCDYPTSFLLLGISQNLTMLVLFSDFYYKAYIKNNKRKTS